MRISGTDIYIAAGDKATLSLNFGKGNAHEGVEFYLSGIDYPIFGTHGNPEGGEGQEIKEQKSQTNDDGVVTFFIDTKFILPGKYYYDIVFSNSTTIIRKALFVVEETARTTAYAERCPSSF